MDDRSCLFSLFVSALFPLSSLMLEIREIEATLGWLKGVICMKLSLLRYFVALGEVREAKSESMLDSIDSRPVTLFSTPFETSDARDVRLFPSSVEARLLKSCDNLFDPKNMDVMDRTVVLRLVLAPGPLSRCVDDFSSSSGTVFKPTLLNHGNWAIDLRRVRPGFSIWTGGSRKAVLLLSHSWEVEDPPGVSSGSGGTGSVLCSTRGSFISSG